MTSFLTLQCLISGSLALVSLVMRDAPNVSDYRRQLVLDAAEQLGYRPNVLARNLASRRTNTIGVVVNDLHNPFFAEIVDGIQEAADAANYRVLLGDGRHSEAGESNAVETFLQFRVDGVVIVGPWLDVNAMERASKSAAVVVVGRNVDTDQFDTMSFEANSTTYSFNMADVMQSFRDAQDTVPGHPTWSFFTDSPYYTLVWPDQPDGSEGGTSPLLASQVGTDLAITWDTTTTECASPGYHLIWGWGADLDSMSASGSDCSLDTSGSHLWATAPDTTSDWAWFLVVGNDGETIEGGWGTDSSSIPRSVDASGECGGLLLNEATCLP